MMTYFASPSNQMVASHLNGLPVLLSFAEWRTCIDSYQQSFSNILIDSGAYSEMSSGVVIDIEEYAEWASRWVDRADAIAGLDDIRGDWRKSLKNYERLGFPTFHDTDPEELLPELIDISRERGNWLGIGLLPPREGKEEWVMRTLERIPDDIHVHGWAMRRYRHLTGFSSMDSTNWWRDGMMVRTKLPWLTPSESLALVMLRYERESRNVRPTSANNQLQLFNEVSEL